MTKSGEMMKSIYVYIWLERVLILPRKYTLYNFCSAVFKSTYARTRCGVTLRSLFYVNARDVVRFRYKDLSVKW